MAWWPRAVRLTFPTPVVAAVSRYIAAYVRESTRKMARWQDGKKWRNPYSKSPPRSSL